MYEWWHRGRERTTGVGKMTREKDDFLRKKEGSADLRARRGGVNGAVV